MRIGPTHPASRSLKILMRATVLTAATLAATNCLPFHSGNSSSTLSERERAIHLLSRTTYGVRPQDVEAVLRMGRREWLEQQLQPDAIPDTNLQTRIASRPVQSGNGATIAVRPAVVAPIAPPAGVGGEPDSVRIRALTDAMHMAREQMELATQQLAQAQRQLKAAEELSTERGFAAAREALQSAQNQHQVAQQHANAAKVQFDRAWQQLGALVVPGAPQPPPNGMVRTVRTVAVSPVASINTLVASKIERAVYSERQLQEVMTDFWFNHFNVYFNKGQVRQTIEDYEQSAIRAHVFGRFEDLLVATARHPAMMVYLDNFQSTVPVQQTANAARRIPAQRGGLNENYARELMELHTLGVDGGYTQQDVIEVARAFTGWGIQNRAADRNAPANTPNPTTVVFNFNAGAHDNGDKVVLGTTITGGRGMDEGMEILGMLARHPSTARHIATKLVEHFVSDQPPQALVDEIARVFTETDGDLAAVTRALFLSNAFYAAENYRAKVKRPFEYIASALRVTGADVVTQGQGLVPQLRNFRHLPYSEAAPTGYKTTAEDWVSAGAMLARMNFGLDLVAGRLPGIGVDPQSQTGAWPPALQMNATISVTPSAAPTDPATAQLRATVQELLDRVAVGANTEQLTALIADDLTRSPPAAAGSGTGPAISSRGGSGDTRLVVQRRGPLNQTLSPALRALGLALGSPEFQRY